MAKTVTSSVRRISDRFEPDLVSDPHEQKKLRGYLEQIDYTVSAANQAVLAKTINHVTTADFQNLALTAAKARSAWVECARELAARKSLQPQEIQHLAHLRSAYEEMSEVYEAMRRMVERGYLTYRKTID